MLDQFFCSKPRCGRTADRPPLECSNGRGTSTDHSLLLAIVKSDGAFALRGCNEHSKVEA
jgi:hypothetical protein